MADRLARDADQQYFERTVGKRRVTRDDGRTVTVPLRKLAPRPGLDTKHGLCLVGSPQRGESSEQAEQARPSHPSELSPSGEMCRLA